MDQTWAQRHDQEDQLSSFRLQFELPKVGGREALYFTGNSLGLQPVLTKAYVQEELSKWAILGVEGHFTDPRPWADYHQLLTDSLAEITGALPSEVVAMNSLTTNLHLLLTSFYKPEGRKRKIVVERDLFPSDFYAVESQAKLHGLSKAEILELQPKPGHHLLETTDILQAIEDQQEEIALVLLGGVNYLTGQLFDLPNISSKCQELGITLGLDLAHAIGNVPLKLHEWEVDFAVWCSYKYLNAGPGAVGGAFVHKKHHQVERRLHGWWGTKRETRFAMEKEFEPIGTVESWQLSNAPILSMSALRASLELFSSAGMNQLRKKSEGLTSYMYELLSQHDSLEIITSKESENRGAQLSVLYNGSNNHLADQLRDEGVIFDMRSFQKGSIMRFAPVPLYNTFEDIWKLHSKLSQLL